MITHAAFVKRECASRKNHTVWPRIGMMDGSVGGRFSPSAVFSAAFKASHDAADVDSQVNRNGEAAKSSAANRAWP